MRHRLALIVTTIAALVALGSPVTAHAAFFKAEAVDGPTADIRSVGDVDIARDGSGAVAYVKADAGVDHVFASRLVGGAWQPPERIDVGLGGAGSQPVVAASDGGRLAIVFVNDGQVYANVRAVGSPTWTGPQLIGQGTDPSADMSFNGAAYATFTSTGGDVLGARLDRTSTTWAGLTGALDNSQGEIAGVGTGRSKVAISADGTGVAVWGENGQVYARRIFNTTPSTAVLDLNLADLEGHPGGVADSPTIDIEDDSSYAWVAFDQQFDNGANTRAIGVRLRGSRTDPPVAFDGLGWGGASAQTPFVDINGKGQGILTAGASNGAAVASVLKADVAQPARPIGGTGVPTEPVGAVAETTQRVAGWYNAADQSVQGVFYDDKTTSRLVPGPGPTTTLSDPAFGAVDPKAGLDVASDRTGDFAFAFVQADGPARRLVVASYDRLPGAFAISTSAKLWRNVTTTPLAWGTSLELWGAPTYTVLVDGKQVAQTQNTKTTLPAGALTEGLHTWRVVATDRRGQTVTTKVLPLKVDTTPPTVTFSVKRKKRVATVTTTAADVIPPSGQAAGIKYVRIDWGDGSAFDEARKASHAYKSGGTYTVKVSATDKAGNVSVAQREIHVSKK